MIYLDYAATTPLAQEVLEAMLPFLSENYANPSGNYSIADTARKAVREAGRKLAALLNCAPNDLFFTGGGTESDNLAITGAVLASDKPKKHIITSAIEHPAVLNTCRFLESLGVELTILDVDKYGFVSPSTLRNAIKDETVLVSVMTANNEIGTLEPIKELCEIAHEHGALFHTDAVQAVGQLDIDVQKTGVDLLSLSAHKIGGPKGVGALYKRSNIKLSPIIHGGGQERGLRSGTENVAGIVGLGKAAELALNGIKSGTPKAIEKKRDYMLERLLNENDKVTLNGPKEGRLPGNINISVEGAESETMLIMLNGEGVCASGGSACSSRTGKPSHVLTALGASDETVRGALRFTLGEATTYEEIDEALEIIKKVISKVENIWHLTE